MIVESASANSASLGSTFLQRYCVDCHSGDAPEGNFDLEALASLASPGVVDSQAEQWKLIWEQVALKEMPPRDADKIPAPLERWRLATWITAGIAEALHDKGGFITHLLPAKGNHLDHDLLFGPLPEGLQPASTPARLWRIEPLEHLTRLNELIACEPAFAPNRPGLRAHGDFIPPNEEGEVKVYYGLDQLIGWVGGTAAYAAAITGFSPMLSSEDHRGLRNYPILYSVNGAEATQIATVAEEILRFMAFGPKAEPYQFADKVSDIDEKYKHESLRGLSQSLFYSKTPTRPKTPIYDLVHAADGEQLHLRRSVQYLFEALTCRSPSEQELEAYMQLAQAAIDDLGKQEGVLLGLAPIFLDRDALFRTELAAQGEPDEFGRVMLQGHELMLAINSAFSYIPPDAQLQHALATGQLQSQADVRREVTRILNDSSIRKPRVLQFFREFFDYDRAGNLCKDTRALTSAGGDARPQAHYRTMVGMTANTDRLIELVLQEDRDVLRELLTTDRIVFDKRQDGRYFGEFLGPDDPRRVNPPPKDKQEKGAAQKPAIPEWVLPYAPPPGTPIHVRLAQVVTPVKTERQLTTLPLEQRRGILTHPAWLVAHSDAMDNHAILRGKWIRERLLGGAVPDVPITVDAMLPAEPQSTLRHRMRVTRQEYCWRCHQKMDPLGLPFEIYNHVGLYRNAELTKGQAVPVDPSGEIIDSGEPALDGPVANALELIDKLADSQRVQQVFVRHTFRFWIGRNETLNDASILQEAYRAYAEHGGSMKALLTSLLTSDAFLYRQVAAARAHPATADASR